MSSRHQGYVWKALKEAGVKTVIDLRHADSSNHKIMRMLNAIYTRMTEIKDVRCGGH